MADDIDPSQVQIDQPAIDPTQVTINPNQQLRVPDMGTTAGGYAYFGGDPAKPESWAQQGEVQPGAQPWSEYATPRYVTPKTAAEAAGAAIGGTAETALHEATGGVGATAGALLSVPTTPFDAAAGKRVRQAVQAALTYEPMSEAGKGLSQGIDSATANGIIGRVLNYIPDHLESGGYPALAEELRNAITLAPYIAGKFMPRPGEIPGKPPAAIPPTIGSRGLAGPVENEMDVRDAHVDRVLDAGVPLTRGQRTGDPAVMAIEAETDPGHLATEQPKAINLAVMRQLNASPPEGGYAPGEEVPFTPQTTGPDRAWMDQATTALGKRFQNVLNNNPRVDMGAKNATGGMDVPENSAVLTRTNTNLIDDLNKIAPANRGDIQTIQQQLDTASATNGGYLKSSDWQAIDSKLATLQNSDLMGVSDAAEHLRNNLTEMYTNTMQRNGNVGDISKFRQAQTDWRNFNVIGNSRVSAPENLKAQGIQWVLPTSKLSNVMNQKGNRSYNILQAGDNAPNSLPNLIESLDQVAGVVPGKSSAARSLGIVPRLLTGAGEVGAAAAFATNHPIIGTMAAAGGALPLIGAVRQRALGRLYRSQVPGAGGNLLGKVVPSGKTAALAAAGGALGSQFGVSANPPGGGE